MAILFLRRRKLGLGSLRGMVAYLNELDNPRALPSRGYNGEEASFVLNEDYNPQNYNPDEDLLIRWGCTSNVNWTLRNTLNPSPAIHYMSNKLQQRMDMQDAGVSVPQTVTSIAHLPHMNYPVVIRPRTHAQGRNLYVANSSTEAINIIGRQKSLFDGWYASEYIPKTNEYRVYIVHNRVVMMAEKIPENVRDIAWNHALGSTFQNVRWGDWNLEVIRTALHGFRILEENGADFTGIDVMYNNNDGRAYIIEANSAPSLPLNNDGSASYRQRCMAKVFRYYNETREKFPRINRVNEWRDAIHPGVNDND